jgi:dynein heavy chain
VEEWLLELEKNMKDTIRDSYIKSLKDYASTQKNQWLFKWPAQVVIAVDQSVWTSKTTEAILKMHQQPNSLKEYQN